MYYGYPYLIFPPAPVDYNLPPTIYSILNAIVNFGEEEQTKIKDLAKQGRREIFDFDYVLTDNISKEDFECMILNHFLMRRIGYDTVTAFKIALCVKLNEILPTYNKMFDMLDGWNLFNDGESVSRTITDNGTNSITSSSTDTSNTTGSITNTSDRRYSDTPQDNIQNVKDGAYITDYNYDTDSSSSSNNVSSTSSNTANGTDSRTKTEVVTKTPSDKMEIYQKFIKNKTAIYTMLFKELDVLFYGLV